MDAVDRIIARLGKRTRFSSVDQAGGCGCGNAVARHFSSLGSSLSAGGWARGGGKGARANGRCPPRRCAPGEGQERRGGGVGREGRSGAGSRVADIRLEREPLRGVRGDVGL